MGHFDLMAPFYDRLGIPAYPEELRAMLDLPAAGRMLDVGGGTGRASSSLRQLVDQWVVCDVSLPMLRRAKGKRGLTAVNARAQQMPFAAASFERILVVDALHHFSDQRQVLVELLRLLKPGGKMVVEEPDIRLKRVKVVALLEKLALMGSRFRSVEAIAAMALAAGARARVARGGQLAAWVVIER